MDSPGNINAFDKQYIGANASDSFGAGNANRAITDDVVLPLPRSRHLACANGGLLTQI